MSIPDGPRQPKVVQLAQWVWRPMPFMEECFRRYGEMFHVRLAGFSDGVFVCTPELNKEIYMAPPDVLHAGKANELLRPALGNHSLLLLDEAEHLRERRLLLPPFHGERMQSYATLMRDLTEAAVDSWPLGQPMAVHSKMQAITLDVILRAVFGAEEGAQGDALKQRIVALMNFNQPFLAFAPDWMKADFFGSPYRAFLKLRAAADAVIYELIRERRKAGGEGREDILSLLLSAKDEAGHPLTDEELRDELMTMLLAGHETSATAASFVIERLMVERAAHEKLEAELDTVLGGGRLEPQHLPKLEYLDATIKETLRLRPIVPVVARTVMKDGFTLGGRPIPKGWMVFPCIYLTQRHPRLFPEPEAFRPERFIGTKPDPYAWMPFGGGMRRCIGMAFALYEIKIILATVLSRVRLRAVRPGGEHVVRRGVILAPGRGAQTLITERRVPGTALRPTG